MYLIKIHKIPLLITEIIFIIMISLFSDIYTRCICFIRAEESLSFHFSYINIPRFVHYLIFKIMPMTVVHNGKQISKQTTKKNLELNKFTNLQMMY